MVSLKSKIYVAGHNGLVGSAIVRQLKKKGYKNIITAKRSTLDLTNQTEISMYHRILIAILMAFFSFGNMGKKNQ